MNDHAAALPLPLLIASVIICTVGMILLTLHTHGRVRRGWGEFAVCVALVLLLVALGVAAS